MLTSTFFTAYPDNKTDSDYGFVEGTITFDEYKQRVKKAIIDKFGNEVVLVGNKSLKIRSNRYLVNADVVVAFMLKGYAVIRSADPQRYVEGTRFYSADGKQVTNYPKEQIANGKQKNNRTNYQYKYLVSISSEFIIDADAQTCKLVYTYQSDPNKILQDKSRIHYGTAVLNVKGTSVNRLLDGDYWTGRRTSGHMSFHKNI